VFPIHAPALRERADDIPLLAGYFCERCRVSLGLERLAIQPQALQLLSRYDWPGNVRELEHAIHRAAVLARAEQGSQTPILEGHHFNLASSPPAAASPRPDVALQSQIATGMGLRAATDAFQLKLIEQTLAAQEGNWAATARALQMDSGNLHRLAKRLGLRG
jgi:anaerobic nitric oxide reductase transcription regulator